MATDGANDRAGISLGHPMHHREVLPRRDPFLDLHLKLH